jgi:hypothetical protein
MIKAPFHSFREYFGDPAAASKARDFIILKAQQGGNMWEI